jgi:hypothetical protein
MSSDQLQPSSPAVEREFISTAELLSRVPISRRTLFTHRATGRIPAVILGDRVLFHWPSVQAALLRQQADNDPR